VVGVGDGAASLSALEIGGGCAGKPLEKESVTLDKRLRGALGVRGSSGKIAHSRAAYIEA